MLNELKSSIYLKGFTFKSTSIDLNSSLEKLIFLLWFFAFILNQSAQLSLHWSQFFLVGKSFRNKIILRLFFSWSTCLTIQWHLMTIFMLIFRSPRTNILSGDISLNDSTFTTAGVSSITKSRMQPWHFSLHNMTATENTSGENESSSGTMFSFHKSFLNLLTDQYASFKILSFFKRGE